MRISGKGILVKRKEEQVHKPGDENTPGVLEDQQGGQGAWSRELGDGNGCRSGGTEAIARTLAFTLIAGSHWRVLNNGTENRP